jgi:endo-1,4-beta-xylanase
VWHQQYPKWLFESSRDGTSDPTKEELLARMKTHIQTVVGHCKGKIDSWDVVNECIGEDGQLRNSKYLQIVGSDEYIASAFRWAREADPNAKLFINDYNTEYSGAKQEGFYNEVKKLLDEGVPIDGVGFQCHISVGRPSVNDIRASIERFAALGLKVQITELDISIYNAGNEPKRNVDRDTLLEQANKYKELFDMFAEEAKKGNLDLVLIWGMSDDETWLDNHPTPGRTDYPLLFGKDLRAKPAYWAVADPDKLPIGIKKVDATKSKAAVTGKDDEMWSFVSPRDISNPKGEKFGSWKMLWTPDAAYALVTVKDATRDDKDGVTLFVEPKNLKQEKRSDAAIAVTVPRAKAVADDGSTYTVFAAIPVTAKLDSKIGFDLRVQDGDAQHSWNDYSNAQDASSTNYGTVSFRDLPPVCYARRGTVKIDGQIDTAWKDVTPVPIDVATQGFTKTGSQFRTLWDDQYVYVLVEVQDDVLNDKSANAYEQDTVEVFIDQNNAKSVIYEKDDAQYRVSFKNAQTFNGGSPDLFKSASRMVPGGYRVEFAIPITAITPQPGSLLGFDVQINEADASGSRTGIRNWVNATNMGYQNTSGFGILKLE